LRTTCGGNRSKLTTPLGEVMQSRTAVPPEASRGSSRASARRLHPRGPTRPKPYRPSAAPALCTASPRTGHQVLFASAAQFRRLPPSTMPSPRMQPLNANPTSTSTATYPRRTGLRTAPRRRRTPTPPVRRSRRGSDRSAQSWSRTPASRSLTAPAIASRVPPRVTVRHPTVRSEPTLPPRPRRWCPPSGGLSPSAAVRRSLRHGHRLTGGYRPTQADESPRGPHSHNAP
jgi:hypothetical protein